MIDQEIWNYLNKKTNNCFGTAAIMGNLMAESSLNPECATGSNKTANYTQDADEGIVDFENDHVAYGLAQWCYHTRKKALLDYAKKKGKSVGNLDLQLDYLVKEMSESYKSVWVAVRTENDVKAISDMIMLKYEKPANTSDAAKKKRADYARKFIDKFTFTAEPVKIEEPKPVKQVVIANENVNVRAERSKNAMRIGTLKAGNKLECIGSEKGWFKVVCWISGEFATMKEVK